MTKDIENLLKEQETELEKNIKRLRKEIEIIDKSEFKTRNVTIKYQNVIYYLELFFDRYFQLRDMKLKDEGENEISFKTELYNDIYDWVMFSEFVNYDNI